MFGVQIKRITKSSFRSIAVYALRQIRKKALNPIYRWIGVEYTANNILNDLRTLGIERGDVVLVHSSLSGLGYVEGGANAIIDALLQAVGDSGTVLMPCFTVQGSMKETLESGFVFDPRNSKATVGIIPETFRKKRGVCRSLHPTHSVCAYGKFAKVITEGHELSQTNFGVGTPLYKFMQLNGKILGLAVDLGPVTFYHVLEDVDKSFPRRVYCKNRFEVKLTDYDGKTRTMKIQAHDADNAKTRIEVNSWNRNFLTKYLRDTNVLREGWVGKGRCWVMRAKDLYEAQLRLAKKGITIYTTKEEYLRIVKRSKP